MDIVTPVVDLATRLWSCTSKHCFYVIDREENLCSLREEMKELKNVGEDVKRRVEDAENHQMVRRYKVNGWLNSLEALEREVNELLEKGDQQIQRRCLRKCWSSYKIGKMAREKISAVVKLKNEGHFDEVADRLPFAPVDERLMEKTVGLDLVFAKVWKWVEDQVGIIGLCGMGGVGKTTLLKMINNEILKTNLVFDVVIWVVVSKPASIEKVQEAILSKLEVPRHEWEDGRSQKIFSILKTKKFVLFLDDIWERLDLTELGVPHPNAVDNASKLIFTTRSADVCHLMGAHKYVKVECLAPDESLSLFRMKVGDETFNSHPLIPTLAKEIVKECKGLPLALITIGRAMAGKKILRKWDQALEALKSPYPSSSSTFSGMVDQVFAYLAFSYYSLPNGPIKSCFLYCSMFPSDYEISEDELVELWIGEGFLIESHDIHRARDEGYDIIESLKVACLLESAESEKHVKMHDMIRDMALWLTTKPGENIKKVVIKERARMVESRDFAEWKEAYKISLWDIDTLPFLDLANEMSFFPNLETLFLRRSCMIEIPTWFFEKLHSVQVLDLSYNYSLKNCWQVHQLVNLEYLNMSFTSIDSLWNVIVEGLPKLRCLILNFTHIKTISISNLSSLRLFSMHGGRLHILPGEQRSLLEELERLVHINDISIKLNDDISVRKLLNSYKLQSCIRKLHLQNCSNMISLELSPSCVQAMMHLETLQITGCNDLKDVKINAEDEGKQEFLSRFSTVLSKFYKLHEVHIVSCSKLLNLTWLIYAPSLQSLTVSRCESMKEVICGNRVEENSGLFSILTTLQLEDLPKLKSICTRVLPFPSLKMIYVHSCEILKKLPFDSNTGKNSLKKIQAQQSWWDGLEWEDEAIERSFSSFFMPSDYINLHQVLGYDY